MNKILERFENAHFKGVKFIATSPNNQWIASGGMDGTLKVWNLKSKSFEYLLKGEEGWIQDVLWTRTRIISAGHSIHVFDTI